MRKFVIPLYKIITLIDDAEFYEYGMPEFYDEIFKWIGKLSEKDIYDYAKKRYLNDPDENSEYDYDKSIETLTNLNTKYGIYKSQYINELENIMNNEIEKDILKDETNKKFNAKD